MQICYNFCDSTLLCNLLVDYLNFITIVASKTNIFSLEPLCCKGLKQFIENYSLFERLKLALGMGSSRHVIARSSLYLYYRDNGRISQMYSKALPKKL